MTKKKEHARKHSSDLIMLCMNILLWNTLHLCSLILCSVKVIFSWVEENKFCKLIVRGDKVQASGRLMCACRSWRHGTLCICPLYNTHLLITATITIFMLFRRCKIHTLTNFLYLQKIFWYSVLYYKIKVLSTLQHPFLLQTLETACILCKILYLFLTLYQVNITIY